MASPNPRHFVNSLNGVLRFSATDAWAVGGAGKKGVHQTFGRTDPIVVHWDGVAWQIVDTPHTLHWAGLSAIAGVSSTDIWAVGARGGGSGTTRSLIEHFDGSTWRIVPSPSPGTQVWLSGLSVSGSSDAWAVGGISDPLYDTVAPLVEHWDGGAWTVVDTPSTGSPYTYLNSIEQTSPTDAWLVGSFWVPEASRPLAEHWNGTKWKIASPPRKGPQDELYDVTATSPTDVWAVGGSASDPDTIPLAYRWDGSSWQRFDVPKPGNGIILQAVSAASSGDVWAYGDYGLYFAKPGFEHWNGSKWNFVPGPTPSRYSEIWDIAAQRDGAFAVGQFSPDVFKNNTRTLAEVCCS